MLLNLNDRDDIHIKLYDNIIFLNVFLKIDVGAYVFFLNNYKFSSTKLYSNVIFQNKQKKKEKKKERAYTR